MIRATFARVGAYGIPADHLTMRITAPHSAFLCFLRQDIICTTFGEKSPCTFWQFSRLLFLRDHGNM